MSFSQKDSFDQHSPNYGARVRDRDVYFGLSIEDNVIVDLISRWWPEDRTGTLLDAACGSGDRLQMLFESGGIERRNFSRVIGTDFSKGMLEQAAAQKLGSRAVYDDLREVDLLEKPTEESVADLILCLWHVMNSNGLDAYKLVNNLGSQLRPEGLLVYDLLTTKVLERRKADEAELLKHHQDLAAHEDPQWIWYEREDGTVGHERLFAPAETNQLLKASGLETLEVWSFREEGPCKLNVTDGNLDERELADFAKLIVLQQK